MMKNVLLMAVCGCVAMLLSCNGKTQEDSLDAFDRMLDEGEVTAYVGDGTSMHNLMLVLGDDTLCVMMDDSTEVCTDLVVGEKVRVTVAERDGAYAATCVQSGE